MDQRQPFLTKVLATLASSCNFWLRNDQAQANQPVAIANAAPGCRYLVNNYVSDLVLATDFKPAQKAQIVNAANGIKTACPGHAEIHAKMNQLIQRFS